MPTLVMKPAEYISHDGLGLAELSRNKRDLSSEETIGVSEDILAGYFQGNFDVGRLRMNAGLRIVYTDQTSRGSQIEGDGSITPISVDNSYTEFLPAVNIRYNLTDALVLRAAYSRALARPPLKELAPNVTILSGTKTGVKGNPDLNPYTANQFDVGLEWYFSDESVLSGTVFVKDIDSLVESSTLREELTYTNQHGNKVTDSILFSAPINGDKARIQGFEVQLQTPLYFLPSGFDNVGTLINYTFADSQSHSGWGCGLERRMHTRAAPDHPCPVSTPFQLSMRRDEVDVAAGYG